MACAIASEAAELLRCGTASCYSMAALAAVHGKWRQRKAAAARAAAPTHLATAALSSATSRRAVQV